MWMPAERAICSRDGRPFGKVPMARGQAARWSSLVYVKVAPGGGETTSASDKMRVIYGTTRPTQSGAHDVRYPFVRAYIPVTHS